jgi:hypothetical protein
MTAENAFRGSHGRVQRVRLSWGCLARIKNPLIRAGLGLQELAGPNSGGNPIDGKAIRSLIDGFH